MNKASIKKFIKKQLAKRGYGKKVNPYDKKYSVLNSDEFVLEKKIKTTEILSLIRRLYPYATEKELMRLGPEKDGGYLVPNDFKGIEACFSPGVSSISEFEQACYEMGMKIFLADKSVDSPNLGHSDFKFLKKFIGCSTSGDFITLEDWIESCSINDNTDLLLQMDIEGFEYISLINIPDWLLKRFRIIVIEFHELHKLWHESFYHFASSVFEKILENHTCVHIHPNNCCGIDQRNEIDIPRMAEFTFIRNDRIRHKNKTNVFPHPLDYDNMASRPHIILPEIWYES